MTAVEDDWNEWELLEGIACDTEKSKALRWRRVISFTRTGASLFQEGIGFNPLDPKLEHWVYGLDSEGAPAIYGTSIYTCKMTSCWKEPAIAVGPWCDRWWNCFESAVSGCKLVLNNKKTYST